MRHYSGRKVFTRNFRRQGRDGCFGDFTGATGIYDKHALVTMLVPCRDEVYGIGYQSWIVQQLNARWTPRYYAGVRTKHWARSGSGGHRRSSGLNMVDDIVMDRRIWYSDLCECCGLRVQGEVEVVRVLVRNGRNRRSVSCPECAGWCVQGGFVGLGRTPLSIQYSAWAVV